jgi:hypothetical protein
MTPETKRTFRRLPDQGNILISVRIYLLFIFLPMVLTYMYRLYRVHQASSLTALSSIIIIIYYYLFRWLGLFEPVTDCALVTTS